LRSGRPLRARSDGGLWAGRGRDMRVSFPASIGLRRASLAQPANILAVLGRPACAPSSVGRSSRHVLRRHRMITVTGDLADDPHAFRACCCM
jgi:hypothetical protein